MDHDEKLKALYHSSPGGLAKLYDMARKANVATTRAKVKAWLDQQKAYQENAPNGKDKQQNWFKITDTPNSWVADSIMMRQYVKVPGNKGAAGFLLFVELTTREAYAQPFKSGKVYIEDNDVQVLDDTEAQGVFEIIKRFIEWTRHPGLGTIENPDKPGTRIEIRHPINTFSSDNGKEFDNALVRNHMAKEGIVQRFHRVEDHRSNGILNSVARVLRQSLYDHWSQEGNVFGQWVPNLQSVIKDWNNHSIRTLKASPEELKTNIPKQNNVRIDARVHNLETWRQTEFRGQPTVLRYLRRNTEDKGLFAKTGRNWSDPLTLGLRKRTGYSYELLDHAGAKIKGGRTYRPYELKAALGRKVVGEQPDPEKNLAQQNRAVRKLQKEGIMPVVEPRGKRGQEKAVADKALADKARAEEAVAEKAVAPDKQDSVPEAVMDHDWGATRERKVLGGVEMFEPLRLLVKWKSTPEFVKRWSRHKAVFKVWDDAASNYQSWQPNDADWAKGQSVQRVLPLSIYNRGLVLDYINTKVKGDKNKGDIGAEYHITKKNGVYKLN